MAKDTDLQDAILKTLCYANVFDYPLTLEEITRWIIGPVDERRVNGRAINHALKRISPKIKQAKGYYYLKGNGRTVSLRKKRERYAKEKMAIATNVGKWLSYIPSVRMVLLTGALAMENADRNDDIDLMIVTRSKRLWLTRLLVLALVSLIAERRKPTNRTKTQTQGLRMELSSLKDKVKNKICLNLFLDEDALAVPPAMRNLYTAHEVVQAKALVSKDHIAERFLKQNTWVKRYLPKALDGEGRVGRIKHGGRKKRETAMTAAGDILEDMAYKVQTKVMESKRTTEKIEPNRAFFHPRNTSALVLGEYRRLLKRYTAGERKGEGNVTTTVSEEELSVLRSTKLKGKTVVLATGVFDILHAEHRQFLRKAKKEGDVLIVGVEPDDRVKALKGKDRPVKQENLRANSLVSRNLADYVFVLPNTLGTRKGREELIRRLKPQIYAISSSTPFQAEKQRVMKIFKGVLKVVHPFNPKISTTHLIEAATKGGKRSKR